MNWFERNPLLVIFLLSFGVMIPAFSFGIGGFDSAIHGQWSEFFANLLGQGELRPTHVPDAYAGYGSYVFLFYPPLSFYLNSIFFPFFADPEKMNFLVLAGSATMASFCSGLACYYWLREKFELKVALLCAVLYIILPQHLCSFFLNASTSQYWCFAFYPIVMMGVERIAEERKHGFSLYAVGQALITITNIPCLIAFSPFAFVYGLMISPKLRTVLFLTGGAITSFALAAFYLLPMLFLKEYVNIGGHWSGDFGFDYQNYFLSLEKIVAANADDGAPVSSYMQIYRVVILSVILAFLLLYRKSLKEKGGKISFCIIVASVFLVFPASNFIWEIFPIIQKVQFPDRFFAVSTVFSILLAAIFYSRNQKFENSILLIIPFLAFSFGFSFARYTDSFPEDILKMHANNIEYYPNYIPYNDEIYKSFYNEKRFAELPKERVEVEKGDAVWSVVKEEPRNLEIDISSKTGAELNIRWFYIPGWEAELDGKEIEIIEDSNLRTMNIKIPENTSDESLKIYLPLYVWEKLGYLISLLTLLIIAAWHVTRSRSNMKVQA